MSEDDCICGHTESQHDPKMNFCMARGCKCTALRTEEELFEDAEYGVEPLDFDHDL